MYIDAQGLLSDAQAVTADAGSTNLIDLGVAGRVLGSGEPMALVIFVDVAADGTTTDETYIFKLQTDDNTSFSSATDVLSKTIGYAALTAGSKHIIPLDHTALERYVRAYYDVGGTSPSVTVTAALMPLRDAGSWKAYPDGYTIS